MQQIHVASHSRSGVAVISVGTDCLTILTRDVRHEDAVAPPAERAIDVEQEAHQQVAFFREVSRRLGFADPDELLSADPAAFVALAAQWRDHNPRDRFSQQIESPEFRA